jgi:hypothetical protein
VLARLLPLTALSVACSDPIVFCNLYEAASIVVVVRDSITDAPIASGATLVIQDGAFIDSVTYPLDPSNNEVPMLTDHSGERPGAYAVTVRRPDYEDWHRARVVVTQGECHVNTVQLVARMVRSP